MSSSYKKIDYRLRIAKSVERRMLCSLFQSFGTFCPLKDYQYIGFGSISFLDFSLFHKFLGIQRMISIEEEEVDRLRFEFNKPYDCIDLKFGESNDILPSLDVEKRSIIWLDYDGKLSNSILSDVDLLFNRLNSGSFLCISFNAQHDEDERDGKNRIDKLSDRIEKKYFPKYLYENFQLNKSGIRRAYYDIINNLIQEVISLRSQNGDNIAFMQLLYFNYSDGAEMNTIGWLFYDNSDKDKIDSVLSSGLPFVSIDNNPFEIKVPALTFKEMREIETKFPDLEKCNSLYSSKGGFLKPSDIESYHKIYKSFSLFAEIQI